jgi:hypothetical protein
MIRLFPVGPYLHGDPKRRVSTRCTHLGETPLSMIAVDATVHAEFVRCTGGKKALCGKHPFEEKESRRWPDAISRNWAASPVAGGVRDRPGHDDVKAARRVTSNGAGYQVIAGWSGSSARSRYSALCGA